MSQKNLTLRLLDRVERIGNRLPDPFTLFFIFIVIVVFFSWLLASMGVSVIHPADQKEIAIQSLLTSENIRRMFTDLVKNFSSFPPLGLVLVVMIGIGVAERSELISTALKRIVTVVPSYFLPAAVVFAGIMSNIAADAGYVVLTPLGAVLFMAFGRHPIAGLAAAFAGVSGGFSANLMLGSIDPLLSGLSTKAAQILDPIYTVQPTANYYFMIASTFLLTVVGSLVTTKIVEPRLGPWKGNDAAFKGDQKLGKITPKESRGLVAAGATLVVLGFLTFVMVYPENAILRDADQSLKPFYESIVALLMVMFLLCGLAYGITVGTIKSDKDVARMASDSMSTMGTYIILAFIAAQFVAFFAWSNIGIALAISGAETLKEIGFTGAPLLIAFVTLSAFMNLFMGSASAKWAVMGPVFIPMFMLMGYSPELVQNAYRIGDSTTNIITPLLPYFPIIVAFAKRYDPKTGIGTLISVMLPYSIAFFLAWVIFFVAWFMLGLPLGPGAPLTYPAG